MRIDGTESETEFNFGRRLITRIGGDPRRFSKVQKREFRSSAPPPSATPCRPVVDNDSAASTGSKSGFSQRNNWTSSGALVFPFLVEIIKRLLSRPRIGGIAQQRYPATLYHLIVNVVPMRERSVTLCRRRTSISKPFHCLRRRSIDGIRYARERLPGSEFDSRSFRRRPHITPDVSWEYRWLLARGWEEYREEQRAIPIKRFPTHSRDSLSLLNRETHTQRGQLWSFGTLAAIHRGVIRDRYIQNGRDSTADEIDSADFGLECHFSRSCFLSNRLEFK